MYGQRKPLNVGLNATVGIEPQSQAQATVNNTVIVNLSQAEFDLKDREVSDIEPEVHRDRNRVDEILLEIYSDMLLYQNKQLLANIVSKNCIIVTQEDLQRVIEAKTGKKCIITLRENPEVGCLAKSSPIQPIQSIRVIDGDTENDFKVTGNTDYIELMNIYHLSLKYVVV